MGSNFDPREQGSLDGVYVGVVTNNEDEEGLGRVKVRFPWRDAEDESNWARIAVPMAGKEMGSYFLPEVDDEVLVGFGGGDIHDPYVLGSLWNGKAKPPETNKDGKNPRRTITSRAGHTITFDDGKDATGIEITTEGGHHIFLSDKDKAVEIKDGEGNTVTMDSKGISLDSSKDVSVSGKNITLKSQGNVKINGKSVAVDGKTGTTISGAKIGINSKGMLELKGNGPAKLQSTAIVQIKGSLIQLN